MALFQAFCLFLIQKGLYFPFLTSFSDEPVVYCLIYLFVVPTARIFSRGVHSFFSNEAVDLCLFLIHAETVFRGTPYFVARSLFDNPFSGSFKAFHFSAKDLFVSFHFMGVIFLKKTSDEKLKTFVVYFFTKKLNKTFELYNFRILAEMLKRKFERTSGNRPRVQQFCSTNRDIRDTVSRFEISRVFLPKEVRNVQGTEEFVRAIEKFEKLSIRVFESQLYFQNKSEQSPHKTMKETDSRVGAVIAAFIKPKIKLKDGTQTEYIY